ncbi:MAG: type VI secretion system tip protein VgrG [Polyangiaceae bacterium]|nr:type VI secretion system tip protein VgrG [Polyangiaceae bacterium]MCW5789224.1 type VI secretion system tip protein VgrG [Polyangiaceae bacterium]
MSDTQARIENELKVGDTKLDVLDFELTEQLNEISLLELSVLKYGVINEPPDAAALLDQEASFRFAREDGSEARHFHGLVVAASREHRMDDTYATRLVIAPKLWLTTKRADCRLFLGESVVDIVTKVLNDAGVTSHEWRVTGSYEPRDTCAQYRETDFDFVRRLLAEEGIWFTTLMDDKQATLVLCDDVSGLGDIQSDPALRYYPELDINTSTQGVTSLTQEHAVRPDRAFLRDYDGTKPSVQLEKEVEGTDEGAHTLLVYEYPGRFTEQGVADHYTQVLLEQLQADRQLTEGESGSLVLRPGERFSVEEHPYAPLNAGYLLVQVRYSGTALGHSTLDDEPSRLSCSFTAVPSEGVAYRPPRRERQAVIPGLQTAWTTGPGGEEIHVDEYGRVKIHYHWDRVKPLNETSSHWVPTSQLALGGSMLLPRMNWEVTLRHNEGDPDRPVVMGRLYNPITPPPYSLPAEKAKSAIQTATTPGGGTSNELRMGDTAGSESMFFNASYDMTIDVLNNATSSVGNDSSRKVGGNQAVNVTDSVTTKVGSNQSLSVSGNQDVSVETYMVDDVGGDFSLSVGGNRTMMIGGDHKRDVGGASSLTVNGMHVDLVVGSVVDSTLASYTHDVGIALVELTTADRSLIVGGMRTENTAAAKIIATRGGRGVDVSGVMNQNVGGAIITSIKGSRTDTAGATYTELVGGAQVTKAKDIIYEADAMITVAMGASVLLITPASVSIVGASCKFDGDVVDTALTLDN